jgi:hypothetical protein
VALLRGAGNALLIGRYSQFTVGELQHLLVGLLLVKDIGMPHSPIIARMIDEVSAALDTAIELEPCA